MADEPRAVKAGKRPVSLRRLLVAGILVWLPIIATIWVISFVVTLMDRTLVLLPTRYQPQTLLGFHLPGLGVIFAFVVVLLTGLLVTNLIGRQLVGYRGIDLMQRIPLVRSVYGGVKSFTESVLSSSNSFRKVVAVEYPRAGIWSIGFVTAEDVAEVSARRPAASMSAASLFPRRPIRLPDSLALVPQNQLLELDMSVDAAMKDALSPAGSCCRTRRLLSCRSVRNIRRPLRTQYCGNVDEKLTLAAGDGCRLGPSPAGSRRGDFR